jgi:hypothetical protein
MGITKLEKDIKKIDKSLDLSISWLEESGIQNTKQTKLNGRNNRLVKSSTETPNKSLSFKKLQFSPIFPIFHLCRHNIVVTLSKK